MHVARFETLRAHRHLTTIRRLTQLISISAEVHQDVMCELIGEDFMSVVGDLESGSVEIGEGAPIAAGSGR